MQDRGTKPFKENRPDQDVQGHFPESGRRVVRTQADPTIEEQIKRKDHGNEKTIIQMTVKKRRILVQVRFDQLAVDEVGPRAQKKKRITKITECAPFFSRHRGSRCQPPP